MDLNRVEQIVKQYNGDSSALIQIMLDIESENRWLPGEFLELISERLAVPIVKINHIATFYKAFHITPRGRHIISVCMGTACHVRGAPRILERITELTGVGPGQTGTDMKFSLDTVNCLGCCAMGPVMLVDDKYYGNLSVSKLEDILSQYD
ncbi:MAG: NAD(P)H-dependent oxidoreductase subunit E [Desulfatiglans sp.]|jgi:NADH-quinone oxidoreductase subunit E|nr:NAD(P)H-dependent oxidoreductase subunit E [Thermodesulfobacteriota bacterium]MEE4354421.1 NAD(P)H-dependent oxidoreductase subunit E [Desulfatiglans sp.]